MFKESFIHFIWQYQYFNTANLRDSSGQSLNVLKPGFHNLHEGPDFKEAKIQIEGIEWNGSVEIHRYASDWYKHQHETDTNYNNVILHVVWENDQEVKTKDGYTIPTLELKGRIKPGVIRRYKEIIEATDDIPCQSFFQQVKPITKLGVLERALTERLETKSLTLLNLLEQNGRDWEETAYQWLASGFGFKTNAAPFKELAQRVPLKVIRKHANNPEQIEALLFGQAGFLVDTPDDPYFKGLKREFDFLKNKYDLKKEMYRAEWTFGRVRPPNYPTIRISQLAALLSIHSNIFSFFSEAQSFESLRQLFELRQSAYWMAHYTIGKESKKPIGGMTKSAIENLMMNVTVPLLVALWSDREDQRYLQQAQEILMHLGAEKNHITEKWKKAGWNVSNAFDSQGLIHLYKEYCSQKRCIHCGIGVELIRKPSQ